MPKYFFNKDVEKLPILFTFCKLLLSSSCNEIVKDGDLREAEKYTEKATGYSIQLVRKPLTDFNREEVFGSDDEIEENGDTLGGDRENAEAFLKWMTDEGHAFVRNGKEVWWYCPENGVYSQDLMGLRMFMGDCPLLDDEYRCMTKKQDNMKVQFMEMIPNDSELYEKMFHSTYRKLAFQNGIYDFEKEMLVEFSPEYFFTFKAPVDLKLKGNEKMKDEVYQKLFVDVFGDPGVRKGELNFALEEKTHDKAQYYLKVLARAIAGEIYDKKFFIVVGVVVIQVSFALFGSLSGHCSTLESLVSASDGLLQYGGQESIGRSRHHGGDCLV